MVDKELLTKEVLRAASVWREEKRRPLSVAEDRAIARAVRERGSNVAFVMVFLFMAGVPMRTVIEVGAAVDPAFGVSAAKHLLRR